MAESTLPSPWDSRDIDNVGQPGSASYSNGSFFVAGSGGDIWGTADAFQFVSQPLAGAGQIVARVVTEQNTSPYAKAGLMIRRSYDAGSAHVILDVKPDGSVEFMTRQGAGASTTFVRAAMESFPAWLKLTSDGSTVTGSVSADGSSWTAIGSAGLSGGGYIGLAVTSHDNSTLNQSIFDNVRVAFSNGSALPFPGCRRTSVRQTCLAEPHTRTAP